MRTFETAAVISLVDHLSGPLRNLVSKVNSELGGLAKQNGGGHLTAGMMTEQQQRVIAAAEKHRKAVERLREAYKDLGLVAAMHGLEKLHRVSEKAMEAGKHLQHQQNLMRFSGMPEHEVQEARQTVLNNLPKTPNLTLESGLETWKEMRSVLQEVEDVPKLIGSVMKAKSVLDNMDKTGGLSEGLGQLVKGGEVLGYGQDIEKFRRYLDASVKAMQVMGKTIDPKQIYDIAKYEKAGGYKLDEKYQFATAMSLAQELKGSSFGKATDQLIKQVTGGFQGNLHAAAKEFVAMGLANKNQFETPHGEIKGMKPGEHVKGYELSMTNPLAWSREVLFPAMEKFVRAQSKEKLDTREKLDTAMIAQIRKAFPNQNAADLITKFWTQGPTLDKHQGLYAQAMGLQTDLTKDAAMASESLSKSLETLGSVMTEGIMGPLAKLQNGFTSWLQHMTARYNAFAKENPTGAAMVGGGVMAGGAAAGLGGTFAMLEFARRFLGFQELNASALALAHSAALLDGAAVALSRSSVAGGLGGLAGNTGKAVGGAAAINAALGLPATFGTAAGAAMVEGAAAGAAGVGTLAGGAFITAASAGVVGLGVLMWQGIKKGLMVWNHEHDEPTKLDPKYSDPGYDPKAWEDQKRDNADTAKYGFAATKAIESAGSQLDELHKQARDLGKSMAGFQGPEFAKFRDSAPYQRMLEQLGKVVDRIGELENARGRIRKAIEARDAAQEGGPAEDGTPLPPRRPADLGGVGNAAPSIIAELQKINAKPVEVNSHVTGEAEVHQHVTVELTGADRIEKNVMSKVKMQLHDNKVGQQQQR